MLPFQGGRDGFVFTQPVGLGYGMLARWAGRVECFRRNLKQGWFGCYKTPTSYRLQVLPEEGKEIWKIMDGVDFVDLMDNKDVMGKRRKNECCELETTN